VDFLYYWPA